MKKVEIQLFSSSRIGHSHRDRGQQDRPGARGGQAGRRRLGGRRAAGTEVSEPKRERHGQSQSQLTSPFVQNVRAGVLGQREHQHHADLQDLPAPLQDQRGRAGRRGRLLPLPARGSRRHGLEEEPVGLRKAAIAHLAQGLAQKPAQQKGEEANERALEWAAINAIKATLKIVEKRLKVTLPLEEKESRTSLVCWLE